MLTTAATPADAFVDLGSGGALKVWGDRVLSGGSLWDSTTRTEMVRATGKGDMRGGLVVFSTNPAFEVRSALDGSLLANIPKSPTSKWGIAIDGSYIWAYANSAVTAWSPTGTLLLTWPVATLGAVFAAPTELRASGTPAGADVIQLVPIDGSPPITTPAFTGTFEAWFQDGNRFLTHNIGGLRVYSKDGVQEAFQPGGAGNAGGTKNFFWSRGFEPNFTLKIYDVAQPTIVLKQLNASDPFVPGEHGIIVAKSISSTAVEVIDLDGIVPIVTTESHPLAGGSSAMPVAVDASGRWAIGNYHGATYFKGTVTDPSASGVLGCGKVFGVGGAETGRVAITTSAGQVLIYDLVQGAADLVATIPFNGTKVELSGDGTVLAATTFVTDGDEPIGVPIHVFELPSGNEKAVLEGGVGFDLSKNGQLIGTGGYIRATDGSSSTLLKQSIGGTYVSPDAQFTTVTETTDQEGCGGTYFYEGPTLLNVVPGCARGWIDDTRVLVQEFQSNFLSCPDLIASYLYDAQGALLGAVPVGAIPSVTLWNSPCPNNTFDAGIQAVSPTAMYVHPFDALVNMDTGAVLASHPTGKGTVAGDRLVYACGVNAVCAVPY